LLIDHLICDRFSNITLAKELPLNITMFTSTVLSILLTFFTAFAFAAIDINTASPQELANEIKGVGLKKAERIVSYRDQHGPFASVMDLVLVKGIGPKTIEKNLDNLTVSVESEVSE